MPFSVLTAFSSITDKSPASPTYLNGKFGLLDTNIQQLNADLSTFSGTVAGPAALATLNSTLTAINSSLTAVTGGVVSNLNRSSTFTAISAVALSDRSFAYITSTSSVSMLDSTNSQRCPIGNVFLAIGASAASSVVTLAWPDALVGGWPTSLVTGTIYYANTTGGLTATPPSAASTIVMAVGVGRSVQTLAFNVTYIGSNIT